MEENDTIDTKVLYLFNYCLIIVCFEIIGEQGGRHQSINSFAHDLISRGQNAKFRSFSLMCFRLSFLRESLLLSRKLKRGSYYPSGSFLLSYCSRTGGKAEGRQSRTRAKLSQNLRTKRDIRVLALWGCRAREMILLFLLCFFFPFLPLQVVIERTILTLERPRMAHPTGTSNRSSQKCFTSLDGTALCSLRSARGIQLRPESRFIRPPSM